MTELLRPCLSKCRTMLQSNTTSGLHPIIHENESSWVVEMMYSHSYNHFVSNQTKFRNFPDSDFFCRETKNVHLRQITLGKK